MYFEMNRETDESNNYDDEKDRRRDRREKRKKIRGDLIVSHVVPEGRGMELNIPVSMSRYNIPSFILMNIILG